MYGTGLIKRILATTIIVVLFAVSAGATWAVADDFVRRDVIPRGASIGGVEVGEANLSDAREIVEARVKGPLLEPVTVRFLEHSFEIDPSDYVVVDTDGMLQDAIDPKLEAPLYDRLVDRVASRSAGHAVEAKTKVDVEKLEAWVAEKRPEVLVPAVDAARVVSAGTLKIVPDVPGSAIDASAAPVVLAEALAEGSKDVSLPVQTLEPKVRVKNLGKTIFVKLSQRKLYLYEGATLVKSYGIAIGTPGHPTPRGWWKVINKRRWPSWTNPGSAWAASMPKYIAPGPGNPLGTRALDLDASGIRIHGTAQDWSIGHAASHGCMRMHRRDVEDLFERVPVGTQVVIL